MLPLFQLLAGLPFFKPITQSLNTAGRKILPKKSFRNNIIIAILLSGLTYPFFGQLGHGLLPVPERTIFRMTIGTGFITWLDFLMIVAVIMLVYWYKKGQGKKMGATLYDLGLASEETPAALSWAVIGKSVIMAFALTGVMYIMVAICSAVFKLDLRFIWPFFKTFNGERIGQFFVYLPFYAAFFLVNAGIKLYGQLRRPEASSGPRTQLRWWLWSILIMLGGLFLGVLIEYIPFFMGLGPGADLFFTPLFGGPFMSALILIIPQFAVFFFLSTWLYRKSGYVYTGSFVVAILAAWVVTGGSSMF
jgi:hypothetical protein